MLASEGEIEGEQLAQGYIKIQMTNTITVADQRMARSATSSPVSAGEAPRIMARLLRALMDQTGIRSHQISVKTIKARPGRLLYTLKAKDKQTNVSMFRFQGWAEEVHLRLRWHQASAAATGRNSSFAYKGMAVDISPARP